MPDRFKYAEVRWKIIDAIRTDLIGPLSPEEVLDENPRYAYIVGMLEPQRDENVPDENEQEIEADVDYEKNEDFTAGEDDDNEPISTTKFQLPSSIGISFYVENSLDGICLDVTWGDYTKSTEKYIDKEEKERSRPIYKRIPESETVHVKFSDFGRTKDYPLVQDSNVHVHVSRIPLKNGYSLVTAYVVNKRSNPSSDVEGLMFQVGLKAHAEDDSVVFIAENICRNVLAPDEFYFEQRPIMGRGRGCAAVWGKTENGRTDYVESAFIPEYEYPGVSAALKGFSPTYFSTWQMAAKGRKSETILRLNTLADSYEQWIDDTLAGSFRMNDPRFAESIGNTVIGHCRDALRRIREGIQIIETDDIAFEAFIS